MNNRETTILAIFFLSTFLIGLLTLLIVLSIKENKRQKREEQQRKLAEQQRRIKEEQLRNTPCCICSRRSKGYAVCSDCWNRSKVLKKELPFKKICTYELINEYRKELMRKVILPNSQFERETDSIKLLSVADILEDKYCDSGAYNKTYRFFKDIRSNEYGTSEELIKKYDLDIKEKPAEKGSEHAPDSDGTEDYRTTHSKPYRCSDGDYVRSKAEREIDNFLFDNRIWHIYEAEYISKETGQKYYPDFYLPDHNLYIEYFGLTDDKYVDKMKEKIKMYETDKNIRFTVIDHGDDANIQEKLKEICLKYSIPLK